MEINKFRDVDLVIEHVNQSFIPKQFVSQGDIKGRTFTVQITDNGEVGNIPGLELNLHWNNMSSGLTDLTPFKLLNQDDSIYQVIYPEQMLTPGTVIASIQILWNGTSAFTKEFEIKVQRLAGRMTGILESSSLQVLVEALTKVNVINTKLQVIEDKIENLKIDSAKKVFNSIQELNSKYPNGSDEVMLVIEGDGVYIYSWKNGRWAKGAKYVDNKLNDQYINNQIISYDNWIKNSDFFNDTFYPMQPFGGTVLSVKQYGNKRFARIKGNNTEQYQGVKWKFSPNTAEFEGFTESGKKLNFYLMANTGGTFYIQLQYSKNGTNIAKTLRVFEIEKGKLTKIDLDFSIEESEKNGEYYDLVIAQNGLVNTDFEIRSVILKDTSDVEKAQTLEIIDKSIKPTKNTASTEITEVDLFNDKFYKVNGTDNATAGKGIRWQTGLVDSDFISVDPVKIRTKVQSRDYMNLIISCQYVDENGVVLLSERVSEIALQGSKMTDISCNYLPVKVDRTKYLRFTFSSVQNDNVLFYISKDTTVTRIFPKTFGEYANGDWKTNFNSNFGTRVRPILWLGSDWLRVTSSTASQEFQGISFPVSLSNNVAMSRYALSFEMMSDKTKVFKVLIQYCDRTGAILKQTFVNQFTLVKAYVFSYKKNIYIENVENAVTMKIIVIQDGDDAPSFMIKNVKMEVANTKETLKNNLIGNYLTNSSSNMGTIIDTKEFRGHEWVRVNCLSSTVQNQGVQFPMFFDKGELGENIEIDFMITSDTDKEFKSVIQYYDVNNKLIDQDFGIEFKLNAQEVLNKKCKFKLKKINNVFNVKFVIFYETGINTFYISDIKAKVKFFENNQVENNLESSVASNLPIFNIIGDISTANKNTKVDVIAEITQGENVFREFATVKWQGDSSLTYPKKSYRLEFFTDETREENKKISILPFDAPLDSLNLKAHWIDWTCANNILISKYISDLTLVNGDRLDKEQLYARNQEQITGYPCTVKLNGVNNGLYAVSTKKDATMFNADKNNPTHAVVEGSKNNDAIFFKTDSAEYDENIDFSVEVPKKLTPEIQASFDELLRLVNSGTDEEFKEKIGDKLNLQSAANWIIGVIMFRLVDVSAKNVCFQTRDGVKWNVVSYDHDLAYGLDWQATAWTGPENFGIKEMMRHKLVERLIKNKLITDELVTGYKKFIAVHNPISIINDYREYMNNVGASNYIANENKWPKQPGRNYFTTKDLFDFIIKRFEMCDKWFTKEYLEKL